MALLPLRINGLHRTSGERKGIRGNGNGNGIGGAGPGYRGMVDSGFFQGVLFSSGSTSLPLVSTIATDGRRARPTLPTTGAPASHVIRMRVSSACIVRPSVAVAPDARISIRVRIQRAEPSSWWPCCRDYDRSTAFFPSDRPIAAQKAALHPKAALMHPPLSPFFQPTL